MADETYPVPPDTRTPGMRDGGVRRGTGYVLQELIGVVPPLAALGLAAYYQTEIAHDVLGFTYPWAVVPAAAIEGGAAYCAVLYDRHLVAGDSTLALRLGMLGYAAGSSALLAWHAHATGKPWQISAALGLLTLSAIFLWGRRGKWRKREILREKGLLDAQVVRFSFARWLAAPLETPGALRYAVKHSISDPRTALRVWRTYRTSRTPTPEPGGTARGGARRTAVPPAAPYPTSAIRPAVPRTPDDATVRTFAPVRPGDDAVLRTLAAEQVRLGREPTLDEVSAIAGGTRPRAVRLRKLLRTAGAEANEERAG